MDPFIEMTEWQPFHVYFVVEMVKILQPILPKKYRAKAEIGITARDLIVGEDQKFQPDVSVIERPSIETSSDADIATIAPPTIYAPLHETKQRTVTLRTRDKNELITAIEFISPSNKTSAGLAAYRNKREEYLRNQVNLVEIDLLRAGKPAYVAANWPKSTYRVQSIEAVPAMVSFYAIGLCDHLPTVGVPLAYGEKAVPLNLQAVFDSAFTIGQYGDDLTYDPSLLKPKPTPEELQIIEKYLPKA